MGEFWFWEPAEHAIQRKFGDPERPIAVCFSQCDFGFIVQPLDHAAGELLFGPEIVEPQLPVPAHDAGELLRPLRGDAFTAANVGEGSAATVRGI